MLELRMAGIIDKTILSCLFQNVKIDCRVSLLSSSDFTGDFFCHIVPNTYRGKPSFQRFGAAYPKENIGCSYGTAGGACNGFLKQDPVLVVDHILRKVFE
jgi:hypothetical protein